ncbi:MAG: DMT family transporter [Saprospiraceae bacterium]
MQTMKPVSSAPDDDLQPTDLSALGQSLAAEAAAEDPLDPLKLRCASQLTKDIARLKATKAKLQAEVTTLQQSYERLQTDVQSLHQLADWAERGVSPSAGPLLPGEPVPAFDSSVGQTAHERIDLPTLATSEQRRQVSQGRQSATDAASRTNFRKGLILSAIAAVLTAWHYGLIGVLGQGGSWLGAEIGQVGTGFVPAVALMWLRMLVSVPVLVLLAPQLYANTWEDLQVWIYTREQLLTLLIGSGIAFFFSQVLIYQSIGALGPAIGVTLLFLYPLTAGLLGWFTRQEQAMTPASWLAIVAIAMGGWLTIRPLLSGATPAAIWLGGLASVCFSIYIGLTNLSYRQRCHPIPVGVVQFSTAAVLSSLVLLVKPLQLADISWLRFSMWGLLLGAVTLLVYLFNYSSLRLVGLRTAVVAAATPLVTLLLAWSFIPTPSLELIQWTGISLVTTGGIAFSKEKLSGNHQP